MIFALEIPDLQGPVAFPGQFVNALMGPQIKNYAGQAMLTSFVRFVEAARAQYRAGQAAATTFSGSQNLYGFFDASSAFEACINYMHRAIRCMEVIRKKPEVAEVRESLFVERPPFMVGAVINPIRLVRDAVQHSYERVFRGDVSEGMPFMLVLAGTELPTPAADNSAQTTKTWDRVEIGPFAVRFIDLSSWLDEMARAAESIVNYRSDGR